MPQLLRTTARPLATGNTAPVSSSPAAKASLPLSSANAPHRGTQLHHDACLANLAYKMLSIGKIALGQHRYYERQVAHAATTTTPAAARHRVSG